MGYLPVDHKRHVQTRGSTLIAPDVCGAPVPQALAPKLAWNEIKNYKKKTPTQHAGKMRGLSRLRTVVLLVAPSTCTFFLYEHLKQNMYILI